MNEIYVLGLDPGLNNIGWAILKKEEKISVTDCGLITTDKKNLTTMEKLKKIVNSLQGLDLKNIVEVAVEDSYVNINPNTSLKLATAKGVIIGYFLSQEKNVYCYSPSIIKKHVALSGNANKEFLKLFLSNILELKKDKWENLSHHEVDAIAIALTHINSQYE